MSFSFHLYACFCCLFLLFAAAAAAVVCAPIFSFLLTHSIAANELLFGVFKLILPFSFFFFFVSRKGKYYDFINLGKLFSFFILCALCVSAVLS